MRGLVWFRRDLRVADQPALAAALSECDEVVGLFIVDCPLLRAQALGSACIGFVLQSLEELSAFPRIEEGSISGASGISGRGQTEAVSA